MQDKILTKALQQGINGYELYSQHFFERTNPIKMPDQKSKNTDRADLVKIMNKQILYLKENVEGFNQKDISDGYHTFGELYEFRKMYNAVLFNEWANPICGVTGFEKGVKYVKCKTQFENEDRPVKYDVHKSWKHHDGEYCFGKEKEWFIVSAMLPTGLYLSLLQ